jgi:STE24 endopeptidase
LSVSRILLLLVIVLWMCRSVAPPMHMPLGMSQGAGVFVGGLLLVVLFMGLWSRVLARHVRGDNLHRSLARFHNSMLAARVMIPVWFGIAIFGLGWGDLVNRWLGPINRWPVELPAMLIGTLPAFAAWMALWWAQFPADRALREQSVLVNLEDDLPVHAPPGFWSYFIANLRLQVLFTIVPVALIIFLHDLASVLLWRFAGIDMRVAAQGTGEATIELLLQLASITMVVLFAPEVLRRVLHTESLPDSPLRQRLESLCRRTRLRYRDILLWKTNHNMGNAAVMGLVPQMRYILLSDVLLETMTDDQIEAVFAHEIGHVKHWHMGWYVVLVATLLLLFFGPGQLIGNRVEQMHRPFWLNSDVLNTIGAAAGFGAFFLIFGYLSRWFERQADVFAARTMELHLLNQESRGNSISPSPRSLGPLSSNLVAAVGPRGAATFASALHRVAVVNNIPVAARNFTHGSIAERVRYLHILSTDPAKTMHFDRTMSVLYAMMMCALLVSGAWVLVITCAA